MADTARDLIDKARQARREDRPADARRDLIQATALAREAENPAVLADALMAWAQIERDLGKDGSALPLYEEAVSCRRRVGEPLGLAHALRHLGDLHRHSERLGLARVCYDEALNLYRTQPQAPALDLANALRPMALLDERVHRRGYGKLILSALPGAKRTESLDDVRAFWSDVTARLGAV